MKLGKLIMGVGVYNGKPIAEKRYVYQMKILKDYTPEVDIPNHIYRRYGYRW